MNIETQFTEYAKTRRRREAEAHNQLKDDFYKLLSEAFPGTTFIAVSRITEGASLQFAFEFAMQQAKFAFVRIDIPEDERAHPDDKFEVALYGFNQRKEWKYLTGLSLVDKFDGEPETLTSPDNLERLNEGLWAFLRPVQGP